MEQCVLKRGGCLVSARTDTNNGTILQKSPTRDVVVIGGSAGSLPALRRIFESIPHDLTSAIFIVRHFPSRDQSGLLDILNRTAPMSVKIAEDGEIIQQATVYLAVPDRHLLVKRETVHLVRGPLENRFRPAVDPLFRSAAVAHGPRVIGIVLSGALDDGTSGLAAIKSCGGIAIAQHPEEAKYPSMPQSALRHVSVDHVIASRDIGPLLAQLSREHVDLTRSPNIPEDIKIELAMTEQIMNGMEGNNKIGKPTVLTCPDCSGALWEVRNGDLVRFRCHVGHSYTADSLMVSQSESLENSLWAAMRALQERRKLCEGMLRRANENKWHHTAREMQAKVDEASKHAEVLRQILLQGAEFTFPQDHQQAAVEMEAQSRESTPRDSTVAEELRSPTQVFRSGRNGKNTKGLCND